MTAWPNRGHNQYNSAHRTSHFLPSRRPRLPSCLAIAVVAIEGCEDELATRQLDLVGSHKAWGLACLLAWKRDRSPPTVSPSWDAPARAIYTSTEYSLRKAWGGN